MITAAFPDPLSDAVSKALAAAAAATDAAHEAESALTARGAAAESIRRTARRMTVIAAAACGTSVVVVALAGFMSLRSAGALRAATEAQNAAGMVFVSQLVNLNASLETLATAARSFGMAETVTAARFTAMADQVRAEAEATRKAITEAGPAIAQATTVETSRRMEEMEVTVIEALADIQLSLAQGRKPAMAGAAPPVPETPPLPGSRPEAMSGGTATAEATAALQAAAARLSGVIDRLEQKVAAQPGQKTPDAAPAVAKPKAPAAARRAPQAESRPAPNPYRFP